MEQIIKQLEEERNALDLKIRKINQAIETLREMDDQVIPEKPKRIYIKKGYRGHKSMLNSKREKPIVFPPKEKISKKKGKYTPEIKKFIEENIDLKNREIARQLNDKFNTDFTDNAIAFYKSANRLTKKNKKEKKRHLCEVCHERTWVAWKDGKQLCQECLDEAKGIKKRGPNKQLEMLKQREKNRERYIGQTIHFNVNGKYACNPVQGANFTKMTTFKDKVTCKNCLREIEQLYPIEEDNDFDIEEFEEEIAQ